MNFTPHLVPMNRGILVTAYAKLKAGVSKEDVAKAYQCYDDEYFVRVLNSGVLPEVQMLKLVILLILIIRSTLGLIELL